MSTQTEVAKFCDRFEQLRANEGLSDLKFYTGEVSESSLESFAREANELFDAIDAGKYHPLSFGDSQLIQQ